jgi:BMFP domain-containing protein YqiC
MRFVGSAAQRALSSVKEAMRPLWSHLIERRLERTEAQLLQRMDLLHRAHEQRLDELLQRLERLEARLDAQATSPSTSSR